MRIVDQWKEEEFEERIVLEEKRGIEGGNSSNTS